MYEETAIFIQDISVRARVPGATSRHVATCRSRYQQRLNKHSSRYSTSTPEISRQTNILCCVLLHRFNNGFSLFTITEKALLGPSPG